MTNNRFEQFLVVACHAIKDILNRFDGGGGGGGREKGISINEEHHTCLMIRKYIIIMFLLPIAIIYSMYISIYLCLCASH
jgi:hypothetical protein